MSEPTHWTLPGLRDRIDQSFAALTGRLAALGDDAFDRQAPGGWSVKQHVAHLAAWERSLVALLRGESRASAMGADQAAWDAHDEEAVNASLAEQAVSLTPGEARELLADSHRAVTEALGVMQEGDLERPYSHFQPGIPPFEAKPVIGWINSNTWEHYEEHAAWIDASVGDR